MLARRTFLLGLTSALAAPAIVRAGSLMPVRAIRTLTVAEIANLALINLEELNTQKHLLHLRWMEIANGIIVVRPSFKGFADLFP